MQCAAVFEGNELVAVFPLLTSYKGAWKIARPMGPATAEYTEPLIKQGPNSAKRAEKLWQVVRKQSGADLINLPFVRRPTPLDDTLLNENDVLGKEFDTYHHLVWPENANTWDEYYNTLGHNHRKKLSQRMKSFAKQGEVTYEIISDPKLMKEHMVWLLERKREWAKHIGLENPGYWLTSDDYINFLTDWANDNTKPETLRMDLLRLNGKVVAAFVVCVSNAWLEWIIGGYDGEYTKWSPGMILQYNFVKWGFDHKLEPDFGIGKEDNKKFWCNNQCGEATIYHITNSAWGKIGYKAFYPAFHAWKKRDKKAAIAVEEKV